MGGVLLHEMRLGGRRGRKRGESNCELSSRSFYFIFVLFKFLQAALRALSLPAHANPLKLPK